MKTNHDQIEEMVKIIDQAKYDMWVGKVHTNGDFTNHSKNIAKYLYNTGYRKASEVAKEIFEEIEEGVKAAVAALQFDSNPIHRNVKHETYSSLMRFVKTIENKYTEEEK